MFFRRHRSPPQRPTAPRVTYLRYKGKKLAIPFIPPATRWRILCLGGGPFLLMAIGRFLPLPGSVRFAIICLVPVLLLYACYRFFRDLHRYSRNLKAYIKQCPQNPHSHEEV